MRIPLRQLVPIILSQRFGANVLTNGTFDSAITGWSAVSTPTTFEWSAGRARIVADSNGDGMAQAVTLVLNARYRLMFDYEVLSGGLNVTKVGMTAISSLQGSGTYTHLFTETDGLPGGRNLLFQLNGAGQVFLDNIRLQRIV
jgi:hypothetical protein